MKVTFSLTLRASPSSSPWQKKNFGGSFCKPINPRAALVRDDRHRHGLSSGHCPHILRDCSFSPGRGEARNTASRSSETCRYNKTTCQSLSSFSLIQHLMFCDVTTRVPPMLCFEKRTTCVDLNFFTLKKCAITRFPVSLYLSWSVRTSWKFSSFSATTKQPLTPTWQDT